MLVIAHRGANHEAPENSWEAFEKSIEGGAERIELDVHLTADKDVVICHDTDIARVTGEPGDVGHMNRSDLERRRLANGEGLPFLEDVIARLLPRVELNIEIKGTSTELTERVARMVKKSGMIERVICSCFDEEPLAWLAERHPEIQRACLWGGDWPRWPNLGVYAPLVFMQRVGATIFHPYAPWLTANLMDQARARGWKVFPWVAMVGEESDREALWAHLEALGVDGLCTNYPRQLAAWLREARDVETRRGEILTGASRSID